MPRIPLPPDPGLSWPVLPAIAAASIVVGAVLLLWGRRVDRCLLAVVGAGAAVALAGPLARWAGIPLPAVRISSAVTLAILCFILTRLAWALLAAGTSALVAVWLICGHVLAGSTEGGPTFAADVADGQGYYLALGHFTLACIEFAWDRAPVLLAIAGGLAAAAPLLICLVRPRLGRIFMTSLIGACGVVAGTAAVVALSDPTWAPAVRRSWLAMSVVAGALTVLGLLYQYRGALAAGRARDTARSARPQKSKSNPPHSADKNG